MKRSIPIFAASLATALALTVGGSTVEARGGGGRGMGGGWRNGPTTQPSAKSSLLQTVNEGQLSEKETAGLKAQDDLIKKSLEGMTGEAKLTKEELDDFEEVMDTAAFYIWSKGMDDEGKVTTRYGTQVFPVDEVTKQMEGQKLTRPQAKVVLTGLRSLAAAKLKLNDKMAPEARASAQKNFNEALAKFFMVK